MDQPLNQIGSIRKPDGGKFVLSQNLAGIVDALNSQLGSFPSQKTGTHKPGRGVILCQITNAADGGGIYAARRVNVSDSASFDPSEPSAPADLLEDDGEDSFLLINCAEAGASTHAIGDGEYVGVTRTGISYGLLEIGIIIGGPTNECWMKITAATINSTNRRWTYTVEEVQWSSGFSWSTVTDGRTGSAYNTIEVPNGETGDFGNGTSSDNYTGTFNLAPLGINAIVRCWYLGTISGVNYYAFSAVNQVEGACS